MEPGWSANPAPRSGGGEAASASWAWPLFTKPSGERASCGHTCVRLIPSAKMAGAAVTVLLSARRQPDDSRGGRDGRAGDVLVVTTTSESTDGMFGELLAISLPGARRGRPGHRRGGSRCAPLTANAVSGMGKGDLGAGNSEGDRGVGERSGGLRGRAGESRRRDCRGCRWRGRRGAHGRGRSGRISASERVAKEDRPAERLRQWRTRRGLLRASREAQRTRSGVPRREKCEKRENTWAKL